MRFLFQSAGSIQQRTGHIQDGTSAYQLIKTFEPDIALIDITMPNMNGLELIELCSHLPMCPKFIILSGYNNFEYVKTAMKYGAINYLLKPVNQEELINTIISTVHMLDEDIQKKLQFQESISVLRNDILIRLLNNRIDNKELREKCQFVNLSFHCSNMHVGILKPLFSKKKNPEDRVTTSMMELCIKLCKNTCSTYAAIDESNHIILIFKDYSNMLTNEDYQHLLNTCATSLERSLHVPILTTLSSKSSNASELSQRYYQCLHSLERQRILQTLFPDSDTALQEIPDIPEFDYSHFVQTLEQHDSASCKELLHQYCQNILIPSNGIDFRYQLIEFVISTMQELKSSMLSNADVHTGKKEALYIINVSSTLNEAEKKLLCFFEHIMEQLQENTNPAYTPLIQNTLNYIKSNYSDSNLSLKSLAQHLNVNPVYLGRQFMLETNEYFSDYLNRIRITQAIHLLKTTDWKTAAISTSVGFANTSYFFTIFKKVTGKRPSDYKRGI